MVYAHLMERLGLKGFRYSPLGLRDGILEQMLAEADLRASRASQDGERALGRRAGGVPALWRGPAQGRAGARSMWCSCSTNWRGCMSCRTEYRLWLESAAMMQDVGKYMNHQGHHRHTQYILANSEIFGFSPEQRAIVSAIARYLGKSRPGPDGPRDALRCPWRSTCERDAGGGAAAAGGRAEPGPRQCGACGCARNVYPKRVVLELVPGRGGAELEAWSLKKEAATSARSSSATWWSRWRRGRARCVGRAATAGLPDRGRG